MKRLTPRPWIAVLALTIALAPGAASAQEADSITISSTFYMDLIGGTVGEDLARAFANGHEHTWTLTLHGTTQSHHNPEWGFGVNRVTQIHATSFDLEFFGPDAATLNAIVSEHIAGGELSIHLRNSYSSWGNHAWLWIEAWSPGILFWVGHDTFPPDTLFPSDANGYPVVGPEPISILSEYSWLGDMRPGNDGAIQSRDGLVTIEGSVGEPEPVVLAIADVFVLEGNRGSSKVAVAVTLSSASSQAITVSYATTDSAAVATQDYAATSGTLTFQPGETRRTISVSIKGDRKREVNETFSVNLSNAVGATIGAGSATVTILNDD